MPLEFSPGATKVCFTEGKQYLSGEAISSCAINQALKQDTSSYHHITEEGRPLFGASSTSNPPQRTLHRTNYTGPHHSQGLVKLDSLDF